MIRAWLVDDEPLALKRLTRLLEETGRVEVVGASLDPEEAIAGIEEAGVNALFLDIEMPGLNGFELLSRLESRLRVVFTTAYDRYAVKAFEADGTDYLLKPVTPEALDRAIARLERARPAGQADYQAMLDRLAATIDRAGGRYPQRLASRVGDRVQFIEVARITHFLAEGKLTYAVTAEKKCVVDDSIVQLEAKLDPAQFQRIHRAYLVNLGCVAEVCSWFGGKMIARLNDAAHTELPIARERVKALKQSLGF